MCAGIKAKEPSSPEVTDAWTIPKPRREKRRIAPQDLSEEYLYYDEDYEEAVSNKIRELWYGKLPTTSTTERIVGFSFDATTRKNWYPDLPIAWGRMLDNP